MSENLKYWEAVKQPPQSAIKQINGGRLKGMSDISPQWRLFAMTETFGPCGIGWKFTIDRQWIEDGEGPERCAMTNISLFIKVAGEWSDAIPGTGGSAFTTQERNGIHTSDEAYKMSLTDALSVAMKAIGVAANIYAGNQDYTKYTHPAVEQKEQPKKDYKTIGADIKEKIGRSSSIKEVDAVLANSKKDLDDMPPKWADSLYQEAEGKKAELEAAE